MDSNAVRLAGLAWSKRNVQVFCFNQETEAKLKLNYVRAYDNDMVRLDLDNAEVTSTTGHWMSGPTTTKTPLAPPLPWFRPTASEEVPSSAAEIVSQWFDFRPLLDSGRAVLVHPGDEGDDRDHRDNSDEEAKGGDAAARAAGGASGGGDSRKGVGLCDEAKKWLRQGHTLLLVKGTPLSVRLPSGSPLRIAGAILVKSAPRDSCKLEAMIISEYASHHEDSTRHEADWENHPRIAAEWYSRGMGMFEWDVRDIYRFSPEAAW